MCTYNSLSIFGYYHPRTQAFAFAASLRDSQLSILRPSGAHPGLPGRIFGPFTSQTRRGAFSNALDKEI